MKDTSVYAGTDGGVIKSLPELKVAKMASPLKVRGVGSTKHETDEYVSVTIYFPGQKERKEALAFITRELHLVDDLRAKMLLGNDI